jgi:Fe2+ or Zn2+ uptake regulation protein
MISSTTILRKIKSLGFRITPVRRILVEIFVSHTKLIDYHTIAAFLSRRNVVPNKSTIYRELNFLVEQSIVRTIDIGDGRKRYELTDLPHHHHLICNTCHKIKEIQFEAICNEHEKKILDISGFQVSGHLFELFGLCQKCSAY